MKKFFKLLILAGVLTLGLVACGNNTEESEEQTEATEAGTTEATEAETTEEAEGESEETTGGQGINVVSREDGSGTRAAFVEIVGVVDENDNDMTFEDAAIQSSTDAAMSTVAGDVNAIGYISLGSLNDTVKALKVNGAEASVEDIQNGTYEISRPFNIAYHEESLSDAAKDLVNFILSKEGQEVVENEGYIAINDAAEEYVPSAEGLSDSITIGGSTSVAPVMEKIVEAYKEVQPDVDVNIEPTGSGAGVTGATDGSLDIGMASRELKDEEKANVEGVSIALDGIAVIVNPENTLDDISLDDIREIYLGNIKSWEEVGK